MEFTERSGVKPEIAAMLCNATVGEFYEAIVDDKNNITYYGIYKSICHQLLTSAADVEPLSRLHEWVPTTV